ncbi:hypothetical protein DQ04_14061010 [Trypanosoma grayi]|uniref:hypothetical protein n=1 Tax=Trypanosoma grayi TaxID=71804 RepID=UPI0004F41FC5|nr:hypothetical protein DQ04_14061010 [Trypanosoma grayi]KEG06411.1 hypothetical protein DQ04_14061010 [Trypanosoma grayi]
MSQAERACASTPSCHPVDGGSARRMYVTLRVAAALLWVPHSLASLYVAATAATTSVFLYVLAFSLVAIALTYYLAAYKQCGDYLMISAWVFGIVSDSAWTVIAPNTKPIFQNVLSFSSYSSAAADAAAASASAAASSTHDYEIPRFLWIAVAILQGVVGGMLCKLKDIDEDRYYPAHSIGERLYVVVPFCTGQWLSFILQNGWRGIVVENLTIVLSLGMVGYCVISYKLLREHTSLARGDLIGFIAELLTTSFGVVFTALVLGSVFVTTLAIPFLKSLFSLNALVSSVGIVLELIVYELN